VQNASETSILVSRS